MKFEINNTEWEIKEVDEATMNNEMKNVFTLGVTIYRIQEILLLKDQANIINTLRHELMHVWLYEYGHAQNDETKYNYEDVCEIVASSNDFINKMLLFTALNLKCTKARGNNIIILSNFN